MNTVAQNSMSPWEINMHRPEASARSIGEQETPAAGFHWKTPSLQWSILPSNWEITGPDSRKNGEQGQVHMNIKTPKLIGCDR